MQKRKSTNISAVETAIAKSVDIDTDQTDTPRSSELEDLNATGQSDDEKAEPRSAAPPIVPDGEPAIAIAKPTAFTLDKFKSKRAVALAGVDAADGTSVSQHFASQGLRSAARGRKQILVIRAMLCQRAD
jgi:hypothetical protein